MNNFTHEETNYAVCYGSEIIDSLPYTATCPEGKVYQDCGTACPLTCDNYNNPPLACPEVCVEGCFCPTGQVEKGEKCVEPPQCSGKLHELSHHCLSLIIAIQSQGLNHCTLNQQRIMT